MDKRNYQVIVIWDDHPHRNWNAGMKDVHRNLSKEESRIIAAIYSRHPLVQKSYREEMPPD